MKMPLWAPVVLGVFLFVAMFGLPVLLSHSEHHVGCPLQSAQTVMCGSTILEHFSMWQTMFASLLSAFAFLCAVFVFGTAPAPVFSRSRVRRRIAPLRPTLLQELYSRGILNRKEPHSFS